MEWNKFLSTEWIVFVALSTLATYAFISTDKASFEAWAAFVGGLAVNLGVLRTWKHTATIKANAGGFKK